MKIIHCFSGGLDSTVLLYYLLEQGHEVKCLSVNYGQRHKKELVCAVEIAKRLTVEHQVIDFGNLLAPLLKGSSQTDSTVDVPEGHYNDETMKLTVVPNRNAILLSLATAWAISTKSAVVSYSAHSGDHFIYPDCRPDFIYAMDKVMKVCDMHQVCISVPFMNLSKADIVKIGHKLNVPFELTYTCYKGEEKHCGKCGSCTERCESFKLANVTDPTIYDS